MSAQPKPHCASCDDTGRINNVRCLMCRQDKSPVAAYFETRLASARIDDSPPERLRAEERARRVRLDRMCHAELEDQYPDFEDYLRAI